MSTVYKNLIVLVLVLSLTSTTLTKFDSIGYNCFMFLKEGNGFYNLDMINRSNAFEVKNVTSHLGAESTIYFNPCHIIDIEGCENTGNAVALVKKDKVCSPLSVWSEIPKNGRTTWVKSIIEPINSIAAVLKSFASVKKLLSLRNIDAAVDSLEQVNLEDAKDFGKSKGIQIFGNNVNNTLAYNVAINLNCNKDIKNPQNITASYSEAQGYILGLQDNNACSFDAFSFWTRLGWGQYIVEGVIALVALVLCVAAIRVYKPTLFSIGFLAGSAITYVFLSLFVENAVGKDWWFWAVIGIAVVVGVICGLLVLFLNQLAFGVAGALLGYILGNWLYELLVHKLDGAGSPVWYYVTLVVMALIFGILSCWLREKIIIMATSVGGAYVSVRMVGTMIGNYPDESFIAQEIEAGEYTEMPIVVYVYLSIMVALSILGLVLQCKAHREDKEKTDMNDKKNNYTRVS